MGKFNQIYGFSSYIWLRHLYCGVYKKILPYCLHRLPLRQTLQMNSVCEMANELIK